MISDKFVGKYMRLAKLVGEDKNPCYSRKIGVVVVRAYDDGSGRVLGSGYNGPPRKTPHCDEPEYLRDVFWPQLTMLEKEKALKATEIADCWDKSDSEQCQMVCDKFGGSKTCPRKIIGAASGTRLELCSCVHAETNAIVNSSDDLHGCVMFCWCGVPCVECTKLIINSGIKQVFVIDWGADYSHGSRWLFHKAGIPIVEHPPEYYLNLGE